MIELKKNIFYTIDDNEVLSIIQGLKDQRFPFPKIDYSKDNLIPIVYYDLEGGGFGLFIIQYYSKKGDSGYSALHVKYFLTENKFNLKHFEDFVKIDSKELCFSIGIQVTKLAKEINYPFNISTVFEKDFIGLIATEKHPIAEITNSDGHKN